MVSRTACELWICATEVSCNEDGNLVTLATRFGLCKRVPRGCWSRRDTYLEVEKNRNGLVPLNACTAATEAARTAIEGRIVPNVEACNR